MPVGFTARDILEQLDEDASRRAAFFPDFDHGYNYHVDARLSAYADASRWAVVIEQLSVNPRWGSFAGTGTSLCFHGSGVDLSTEPETGKYDQLMLPNIVSDGPSGPLLKESWSDEICPNTRDIRIRGQVISIHTDESYYWARRIDVERLTHEQIDEWIEMAKNVLPPDQAEEKVRHYESDVRPRVGKFELRTWHLMRGLVPEHRELLLATEAERRRGIAPRLELLMQADNWDHPHLLEGELPSSSDAFKHVAEVLAERNPKLWTFGEDEGNVHWRNWPHSGSL